MGKAQERKSGPMKIAAAIVLLAVVAGVSGILLGTMTYGGSAAASRTLQPSEVGIGDLLGNAQLYDGKAVVVHGYLVKDTSSFLGDPYILCTGDPRKHPTAENPCVAVHGRSEILDRYISFLYDGSRFQSRSGCAAPPGPCVGIQVVVVEGLFHIRQAATDSSRYWVELLRVDPENAWSRLRILVGHCLFEASVTSVPRTSLSNRYIGEAPAEPNPARPDAKS